MVPAVTKLSRVSQRQRERERERPCVEILRLITLACPVYVYTAAVFVEFPFFLLGGECVYVRRNPFVIMHAAIFDPSMLHSTDRYSVKILLLVQHHLPTGALGGCDNLTGK